MPKKILRLNLAVSPPAGESVETSDLFLALKAIESLIKQGATAGQTPFSVASNPETDQEGKHLPSRTTRIFNVIWTINS